MQTVFLTLNIVGCGKVGKTLARLWHEAGIVTVQDVLNRSSASAQAAVDFIGAGRAVDQMHDLRAADLVLLGTPDDLLSACATELAASQKLSARCTLFHCSGALPSTVLAPLRAAGAAIASVHPVRSFAQPEKVVREFAGTWCGVEGDAAALAVLAPLFERIGARFVVIDGERKVLYHAGAVFASNYLVTLLDAAVQAYGKAGIAPEIALQMMAPLVRETAENVLQTGPEKALTGPIARGDVGTVIRQYRAVHEMDHRYGSLYRQLGKLTWQLARRRAKR